MERPAEWENTMLFKNSCSEILEPSRKRTENILWVHKYFRNKGLRQIRNFLTMLLNFEFHAQRTPKIASLLFGVL